MNYNPTKTVHQSKIFIRAMAHKMLYLREENKLQTNLQLINNFCGVCICNEHFSIIQNFDIMKTIQIKIVRALN